MPSEECAPARWRDLVMMPVGLLPPQVGCGASICKVRTYGGIRAALGGLVDPETRPVAFGEPASRGVGRLLGASGQKIGFGVGGRVFR